MKICRPRPQLVFTFDNRFSSTGCAGQQSVRYIIFRLQASYLSATSHTGRESCRVKSLYMKRFWGKRGIGMNTAASAPIPLVLDPDPQLKSRAEVPYTGYPSPLLPRTFPLEHWPISYFKSRCVHLKYNSLINC